MPFALDYEPTTGEMAEAINYLLANFGPNISADPNTGQIVGPTGIVVGYLYKYMSVKYADSADGSLNFSNTPTNRLYYGIRNSEETTESTNPADYIWFKVAGGGFSTTKFLYYQTTGGRNIQFVVSTTDPGQGWAMDTGAVIDLDVITAVLLTAAATPTIYQWTGSSTPPARPTTTTTYTWATATYTAPSGWYVTPPSNTTPGAYLWAITIPIVADTTTTTTTLDWTNTSYLIRAISYNGTDGAAGPNGLNAITAYLVQSQAAAAPTGFPQTTVGSMAPTGWSLTAPSVSVGQVLWYSQGQFNNSSTTINGISPNTTYWNNPVAASIFQDIRSDNWNGSTPPTYGNPATYGTAGYYIQRNTGDVYFNNGVFRADIQTDGDAQFEGKNPTSFQVRVSGTNYYVDYSSLSNGLTTPTAGNVRGGVVGYAYSAGNLWNVGVIGYGRNNSSAGGIGVVGQGDKIGGYFSSSAASDATLQAVNLSGGPALFIQGSSTFVWNGYSIPAPTGSTTTFLRNDGTWATPSGSGIGTVTSVSGTGNVYGLTLTGTVTSSGSLTLGGSFNSNSIPISAINLSGQNIVARLLGTSGATSGVTDVTFSGTLTGGASGTISWTMGSNTAAININVTSDQRLKKDIKDLSFGLDFIKKLRPVEFKWNHELFAHYGNKQAYGFLANEVESIVGENTTMVTTIEQGPLEGYKSFSNDGIVSALVKAVQELTAKVESLEAQLQASK